VVREVELLDSTLEQACQRALPHDAKPCGARIEGEPKGVEQEVDATITGEPAYEEELGHLLRRYVVTCLPFRELDAVAGQPELSALRTGGHGA
jgi:hypothetical protein